MKAVFYLLLVLAVLFPRPLSSQSNAQSTLVAAMEKKLDHIQTNGILPHPDSTPTEFTQDEINAYFASGKIELPAGVQSVRFAAEPSVVTATTQVDFDKLRAGQSSMNPLLAVFTGVHSAVVAAHAHGAAGFGYVHVDSVELDGVEIPHFALQLFVEKFLQPKYPEVGLDSKFALPNRIDTATVKSRSLALVQK
jgi:hypothetical protein